MHKKIKNNSGSSIIILIILLMILSIIAYIFVDNSSIVRNARIRGFMDEINSYKKEVMEFELVKGRYPGDLNKDLFFSWCGGSSCPTLRKTYEYTNNSENYKSNSFLAPYNQMPSHSFVAPFIDLFLSKPTTYFKPDIKLYDQVIPGKTIPHVNTFKDMHWHFYTFGSFLNPQNTEYNFLNNIERNSIWFGSETNDGFNVKKYLKTFQGIEKKIDDGNMEAGEVRAYCSEKGCSKLFILLTDM